MKHWYTTLFGLLASVAPIAHSVGVPAVGHVGSTDFLTLISGLGVAGLGLTAADAARSVKKNGSLKSILAVMALLLLPISLHAQNECVAVVPGGTRYTVTRSAIDSSGTRHDVWCQVGTTGKTYYTLWTIVSGAAPGAVWGTITGTLANQTDLNTALGLKAPLASPALTGVPTVPTAAPGTNTTQAASTAFTAAGLALKANLASPTFTGTITLPDANTWSATGWHLISPFNDLAIDFGGSQRFEFDGSGFFLNSRMIGFNTTTWNSTGVALTFDSALQAAEDTALTAGPATGLILRGAGAVPVLHQTLTTINQITSATNWEGLQLGFNANNDALLLSLAGSGGTKRPILIQGANCLSAGGTCGRNATGSVTITAGATTATVATTAVTANSQIFITEDSSLGTALSVTCNTVTGRIYTVSTRTAGTSFIITASAAPAANPACLSYWIVN